MTRCHACNRAASSRTYHQEIKTDPERYARMRSQFSAYTKTPEGSAALMRGRLKRAGLLRSQFVEAVDREYIWERDGGICGICGEEADPHDWHLDHIVPLSRDGEHSQANTQVSHPRCNLSKRNRLPEETQAVLS